MNRPHRRDRGFTLMELMVVIVILGLLVSIVAVNYDDIFKDASQGTAKAQMAHIEEAIKLYRLKHRKLPESLQDLVSDGKLESVPKDPWDGEYQYTRIDKTKFELKCLGQDQAEGGEGADEDFTLHDTAEKQ